MNVLFLDSIDGDTYGGMEEWIRLVASGLTERGHCATVCGRQNSHFLRRVSVSCDKVEIVPLSISGDFNPLTIARIRREIEMREIDVVITNFNKDIRLGGIASIFASAPRVIWSAGLDITRDNIVHRHLTPRLIDGVIVPSHSLGKEITRHGYISSSEVEVIPIGIAGTELPDNKSKHRANLRERFSLPNDAVVAVTSGRFVEQKGHSYLLDAIPEIIKRQPNCYFLFLGNGPLESQLRKQVEKLGVVQQVVFAGMLDSVAEILAGCDLMIHPSIAEPFGIAILEGMRASLPVVASRVGGIPEVVEESVTALLVEPKNSESLSANVCGLLSDTDKMRQLGEQGHLRWRNKFNISTMIDHVEQYLEQVIKGERISGSA